MFQGLLIFGIGGVVVIAAYITMITRRRARRESLPQEDRLTDEQFRKVEYGDDE